MTGGACIKREILTSELGHIEEIIVNINNRIEKYGKNCKEQKKYIYIAMARKEHHLHPA